MSRRRSRIGWDAVRAQLTAQFARCGERTEEETLAAEARHIFRVDDVEPYFGPTPAARQAINQILGLAANATQLDWETEIRKPASLEAMVGALGDETLDGEARSAIALLLLDHLDRMAWHGLNGTELLARIRWHLRRDAMLQARMRYWWTHMEGSGAVMEALS